MNEKEYVLGTPYDAIGELYLAKRSALTMCCAEKQRECENYCGKF